MNPAPPVTTMRIASHIPQRERWERPSSGFVGDARRCRSGRQLGAQLRTLEPALPRTAELAYPSNVLACAADVAAREPRVSAGDMCGPAFGTERERALDAGFGAGQIAGQAQGT